MFKCFLQCTQLGFQFDKYFIGTRPNQYSINIFLDILINMNFLELYIINIVNTSYVAVCNSEVLESSIFTVFTPIPTMITLTM